MGWMKLGYILAFFIAWHMWSNFICLEPRFLIPDSRLLILIQHAHIYVISWNKQHCKKIDIDNSSFHIYFCTNSEKSKQPNFFYTGQLIWSKLLLFVTFNRMVYRYLMVAEMIEWFMYYIQTCCGKRNISVLLQ